MLLCLGVRKAFKIKTFYYKNIEKTTENFLKMRFVSDIHYDLINKIKTNDKNNPNWNKQSISTNFFNLL